jgi:taurine dioxygenase
MSAFQTPITPPSGVRVTPLSPTIGAIIEGVDLSQPISPEVVAFLEQVLITHQVIFFRNQPLTDAEHFRFASHFGALHIHPIYPNVPEQPEILILDSARTDLRDNALWHTDVSFSRTPPLGSILSAKKIPPVGGDTLWASGTAAYAALSPAIQSLLAGLTAEHDIAKSFPPSRFATNPAERIVFEAALKKNPPVSHPVVRTHPISGLPALFVSEGFTTRINELSDAESTALLTFLFQHSQKPDFAVRWRWQQDDVAFWDNRVTFHYAIDDYRPQHRVMHRATIHGDQPYFLDQS